MNSTQVYDVGLYDGDEDNDEGVGDETKIGQRGKIVADLVILDPSTHKSSADMKPIFQGDNLIGSKELCQIQLNHQSVSEKHALIVAKDGQFILKDLLSTNKTFIENPAGSKNFVELKFGVDAGKDFLEKNNCFVLVLFCRKILTEYVKCCSRVETWHTTSIRRRMLSL